GVAILDARRHHRPRRRHSVDGLPRPRSKARAQCITLGGMDSPAICGDLFIWRAAPHTNDDGATKDRIRKPTKASASNPEQAMIALPLRRFTQHAQGPAD